MKSTLELASNESSSGQLLAWQSNSLMRILKSKLVKVLVEFIATYLNNVFGLMWEKFECNSIAPLNTEICCLHTSIREYGKYVQPDHGLAERWLSALACGSVLTGHSHRMHFCTPVSKALFFLCFSMKHAIDRCVWPFGSSVKALFHSPVSCVFKCKEFKGCKYAKYICVCVCV